MGRKHFFQENFERQLVGWEADGGQYLQSGAAEVLFAGDTGMWVLVGEFLSTDCSVRWASDWHRL